MVIDVCVDVEGRMLQNAQSMRDRFQEIRQRISESIKDKRERLFPSVDDSNGFSDTVLLSESLKPRYSCLREHRKVVPNAEATLVVDSAAVLGGIQSQSTIVEGVCPKEAPLISDVWPIDVNVTCYNSTNDVIPCNEFCVEDEGGSSIAMPVFPVPTVIPAYVASADVDCSSRPRSAHDPICQSVASYVQNIGAPCQPKNTSSRIEVAGRFAGVCCTPAGFVRLSSSWNAKHKYVCMV